MRRRAAAFTLASALALGCGARSELRVPDARASDLTLDASPDVAPEASVDVPPPECRVDRDCDDGVACTESRCAAGRCVHTGVDARCDDGLRCNGPERCDVARGCVAGAPLRCDDGVACTVDRCDDASQQCAATPSDDLCPISHRCDVARGCVARALAVTSTNLFEVELPSGALRSIGRVRAFTDVALHPDRTLYGVNGSGELYRIDPGSALSTFLGATGVPLTALDAAPDGTLFGAGPTGLYRVDPATFEASFVAAFPPGLEASGDLALLEGALLATARTGPGALDELVFFEPRDGTSRRIGPTGFSCIYALAAFGRSLYGMTCVGDVLSIDPATGAARRISSSSTMFYGATAR
ncbi:MAG: hypothetical protein R3A48_21530 [Polyangiales bacterium]